MRFALDVIIPLLSVKFCLIHVFILHCHEEEIGQPLVTQILFKWPFQALSRTPPDVCNSIY
jgi:hypothetical protein